MESMKPVTRALQTLAAIESESRELILADHALAVVLAWLVWGDASWLFGRPPIDKPANYGLSLPGVCAVWLLVLLALYPLCRWFAGLKQRHTEWWWSYL